MECPQDDFRPVFLLIDEKTDQNLIVIGRIPIQKNTGSMIHFATSVAQLQDLTSKNMNVNTVSKCTIGKLATRDA